MSPTSLAGFGVLWDMDGVLVDTGEFHFQAWDVVLAEAGIPFSRARFQETFGMNNAGLIAALLGRQPDPGLLAEIDARKERVFRESIRGEVQPLPGVLNWLDWLGEHGARQALASSAPTENIAALIDELGIRPYFQAIYSGSGMPSKPDPAVFLSAAQALDLPPEACLVIEDATAGVTAAKRAGMRCLALTTTHPPENLTQADWIVLGFDQLTVEKLMELLKGNRE